MLTLIWEPE